MMEAMQKALEVPHMTFCDEVNADRLGQVRSDLKEAAERRGVRLSYLPLIVKVGPESVKRHRPPYDNVCVIVLKCSHDRHVRGGEVCLHTICMGHR